MVLKFHQWKYNETHFNVSSILEHMYKYSYIDFGTNSRAIQPGFYAQLSLFNRAIVKSIKTLILFVDQLSRY